MNYEVRESFNRALAMMHHMMYDPARDQYTAVKARDPDGAMAYWRIAMTRFQPLWGTRPTDADLDEGRRNLLLGAAWAAKSTGDLDAVQEFGAHVDR